MTASSLGTGVSAARGWQAITPSPHYVGWWPATQDTADTNLADRSGKGNDCTPGATLSGQFSTNQAWFTTTAGSNTTGGFELAAAAWAWDMSLGDSLLIAFRFKLAAIAATTAIIGSGWTSGGTVGGFDLVCNASGFPTLRISDEAGNGVAGTSGATSCDDNVERHMVIAIDGQTKLGSTYIGGEPESQNDDFSNVTGPTRRATNGLTIGTTEITAPNLTATVQMKDIHVLRFPARGLPSNINVLVKLLASQKLYPLAANQIVY